MTAPNLYLADFWAIADLGNRHTRVHKVINKIKAHQIFIDGLILHNKIVIPTQEFIVLIPLIKKYGQNNIIQLMEKDIIRFIRLKGSLLFQKGLGVRAYSAYQGNEEDPMHPFCAELDELITSLSEYAENVHSMKCFDKRFKKLIIKQTKEISAQTIADTLFENFKRDIKNNSNYYPEFNNLTIDDIIALNELPNEDLTVIGDSQDDGTTPIVIQKTLEITTAHLELLLSKKANATDFSTSRKHVNDLLNKFVSDTNQSSLAEVFTLSGIPDLFPIIDKGELDIKKIIKIRESRSGKEFRDTFHEKIRDSNPDEIAKEYQSIMKYTSWFQKKPMKRLRGVLKNIPPLIPDQVEILEMPVSIAGIIGPTVNIVDYILEHKIFRGHSPKIFLEDLKKITSKN